MLKTWLFVIACLFIQEPTSTDAAIFLVRQNHLNLWVVNVIWLAATIIDIVVGYLVGKWIQRAFQSTRLVAWSKQWAEKIEQFIGKSGERFVVILLGVINFPYLNAFLFSWLRLSFKNLFVLLLIGNAIYWLIEWGINIGVRSAVADPHMALYVIVAVGLLFSVISKALLNKMLKKQS